MNRLLVSQLTIAGLVVLAVALGLWQKQREIRALEKRCQRLEGENEEASQQCANQAKLLHAAVQESNGWRALHSMVVIERNRANSEILMLRPQLQLSEKERAKLVVQNRLLRETLEISRVVEWPVIALPTHQVQDN
jgi:hypothetical protein